MPSDIAVITPYFNFANYDSVRQNLYRFRQSLTYKTTVVELSLTGRFHCATESHDLRLASDVRSIMFQRNRLVNLAIRRLPDSIKKVAWVDGDVLFEDPQWLDKLSEVLDDVEIAQPFDTARSLDVNGAVTRARPSWCSIMGTDTDKWASSRGYAWGARLDALPRLPVEGNHVGLLDRQLVSEDTVMAMYWAGLGLGGDIKKMGQSMEYYCRVWSGAKPQRKLGFVPGVVSHLYHGEYASRYGQDRDYLSETSYDPLNDLVIDPSTGIYRWSPMRERSIVYFLSTMYARDCDAHLPKVATPDAAISLPAAGAGPQSDQPVIRVKPPAPYKPTIAIITPSLGLGGAEQWIRCLVTYCKDFNWVVGCLGSAHWHEIVGNAVIAHATEVHAPANLHNQVTPHNSMSDIIKATVARANAVIVWGGGDYWPLPTIAPIIFVGHGTCQWTIKAASEALAAGAQHFSAVSGRSADVVRTVVPNVKTIWNGVDTARLKPPEDRDAVRALWKPNAYNYTKYVGYVGRLGNEKNLDSLIHAVAALPFHYHLVLIGCTGWKQDRILPMARTMLPERLIEVPATDALGIPLGALDCMVQVSPREGHSLAICEGMLCRVPIVSNMTGALPELEMLAGRELVEHVPDDPLTSEIAAAIRKVCNTFPTEMVDAAEEFAKEHLTETAMCKQWTAYLNGIVAAATERLGTA